MKGKYLAVLCHIGGFVGSWICMFGGILIPLVIWGFGKSPDKTLLNQHGKEAINFQISMLLYALLISAMLLFGALSFGLTPLIANDDQMIVAFTSSGVIMILGVIALVLMLVFEAICVLIAIIKAVNEQDFHYPLTIRLIK